MRSNRRRNGPMVGASGALSSMAKTTVSKTPAKVSVRASWNNAAIRLGSLPKTPQPQAPSTRHA
jgi:hypothetical protein